MKDLPMEYGASLQPVSSEDTWEVDVIFFYSDFHWKKYVEEDFSAASPKYCSEFMLKPWAAPKSPESQCCHFH